MKAVAVMTCSPVVNGHVLLSTHSPSQIKVACKLEGLTPGLHGIHIHECGDLRKGCKGGCSHYNPDKTPHGGPRGEKRHRGDLGNIHVSSKGTSSTTILADLTVQEVLGRMIVIHSGPDDLGRGSDPKSESKKTGNSGSRVACGIIGLVQE